MNKLWTLLAALLAGTAVLGTPPAERASAWSQLGPEGGDICGLARNPKAPGEIYAVVAGYPSQVFRSTNGGARWLRTAAIDDYAYDLAADPKAAGTLYVLGYSALYKSSDRGSSFTKLAFPSSSTGEANSSNGRIVVHPLNPKIIYVAGGWYDRASRKTTLAVHRTQNGGAAWKTAKLDAGVDWIPSASIALAKSSPNVLYFGARFYTNDYQNREKRVYRSLNGGASWTRVSNAYFDDGYEPDDIAIDPKSAARVFIATAQGVVYTTDGGATWNKQSAPSYLPAASVAVDPADGNVLYAQTNSYADRGVYRSADGGANWVKSDAGVYGAGRRILAGAGAVILGSTAGIFRSLDGGGSFQASHKGIKATLVQAFAIAPSAPNTIYADVMGYGYFRTANAGSTWTPGVYFYRCESITDFAVANADPNRVYILAGG